jgi:hypothetical protein
LKDEALQQPRGPLLAERSPVGTEIRDAASRVLVGAVPGTIRDSVSSDDGRFVAGSQGNYVAIFYREGHLPSSC